MGLAVAIVGVPHTNYPLLVVLFFLGQNRKEVIGLIAKFLFCLKRVVEINQLALRGWYDPLHFTLKSDFVEELSSFSSSHY
jgi:hypothetical protein